MGRVIYMFDETAEDQAPIEDSTPLEQFFRMSEDGESLIFSVDEPVQIRLTAEQAEELGVVMIQLSTMLSSYND